MSTTRAYAVIYEDEGDGSVSAHVPDLAVYVSAPSMRQARKAVREGIELFLANRRSGQTIPKPASRTEYVLVRGSHALKTSTAKAAAYALGTRTSARKAAAARENGRKGGRPRKATGSNR